MATSTRKERTKYHPLHLECRDSRQSVTDRDHAGGPRESGASTLAILYFIYHTEPRNLQTALCDPPLLLLSTLGGDEINHSVRGMQAP